MYTIEFYKRQAKRFKKESANPIKLSYAQACIAREAGFSDWHALEKTLKNRLSAQPGQPDGLPDSESPLILDHRRDALAAIDRGLPFLRGPVAPRTWRDVTHPKDRSFVKKCMTLPVESTEKGSVSPSALAIRMLYLGYQGPAILEEEAQTVARYIIEEKYYGIGTLSEVIRDLMRFSPSFRDVDHLLEPRLFWMAAAALIRATPADLDIPYQVHFTDILKEGLRSVGMKKPH